MSPRQPLCPACAVDMAFAGTADDAAWCASCGTLALLTESGWTWIPPRYSAAAYADKDFLSDHDKEVVEGMLRDWKGRVRGR